MSLLRRAVQQRASALVGGVGWSDPAAIPPNSSWSRSSAGVVVNDQTALQVLTVLSCVRLNADTVAGLSRYAYRQQGRTRVVLDNQPGIVADPFDNCTPHEGMFQVMASLQLRGNAYLTMEAFDSTGYPTKLHVWEPNKVVCRWNGSQRAYWFDRHVVDPASVVHIRWITLPGAAVGINPIENAAVDLGLALATAEYGARFFSQGAQPSGVLSTEKLLTKEQVRRVAQDWAHNHGGIGNAHLPAVLDAGLHWEQLSVNPEQAQFLASREFERAEIAMMFGVPPHLIGDVDRTTSWGKGIEEQTLGYLNFGVRSFLSRIEQAWSMLLPRGTNVWHDTHDLLRTNLQARYAAYMLGRTGGWLSKNDIRRAEDLDPIADPDGDDYASPLNSATTSVSEPADDTTDGDRGQRTLVNRIAAPLVHMNGRHP